MTELAELLSDLVARHPQLRLDLLGRLLLAMILGGAIGWERSWAGKPAGLRTNILICVGATLLTDVGMGMARTAAADPSRLSAQIVSGIGFLGAGTIIQARGTVTGLTTAATLWVVGAIGIAVGSGHFLEATGTTLLVLIALMPLSWIEGWLDRQRERSDRKRGGVAEGEGPE